MLSISWLRSSQKNLTHPIDGSSANMTASASTVLGVAKGGKTATAFKPAGTNARTEGDAPFGDAPPPIVPGCGFPVRFLKCSTMRND